jgi:hypothetical protein
MKLFFQNKVELRHDNALDQDAQIALSLSSRKSPTSCTCKNVNQLLKDAL